MKRLYLLLLLANLAAVVCFVCGAACAFRNIQGWAWFLIAGCACINSIRVARVVE